MIQKPIKNIHFIGIGGSGVSAVAQIAKYYRYQVTGCDVASDTPYIQKVKSAGIKVFTGHDISHIKNADLVAVTPAVFYQNENHPEILEAKNKGVLIKWQDFLGQYLHKNKSIICVAGTHGKSTTTAMVGHLLQDAKLDPTVEVGATDIGWKNNILLGKGKYFVSEADEFHDNFASYHPDYLILNNIEMDHPEYFLTFEKMLESYQCFVSNMPAGSVLIYNAENIGNQKLIKNLKNFLVQLVPYYPSKNTKDIVLTVLGQHNKCNALGVLELAKVLGISEQIALKSLSNFVGLNRRLELIGTSRGVKVFDDYANHPSAFRASLEAIKSRYSDSKITVVIEPHTVSRLKFTLDQLAESLVLADKVIISKIFTSREKEDPNFTGQNIADVIKNSEYIPDFDVITKTLSQSLKNDEIVLVMGSGNSHQLARQLLETLKKIK